jgi:hypothetical protein
MPNVRSMEGLAVGAAINELNPVSEWVCNEGPSLRRNGLINLHFDSSAFQLRKELLVAGKAQRGMGLPSWRERLFHSKMQLQRPTLKPHSAPRSQFHRFWNLSQAKQLAVERARRVLLAPGHGQLHMVEAKDLHE